MPYATVVESPIHDYGSVYELPALWSLPLPDGWWTGKWLNLKFAPYIVSCDKVNQLKFLVTGNNLPVPLQLYWET